jgi:hypothetical protein
MYNYPLPLVSVKAIRDCVLIGNSDVLSATVKTQAEAKKIVACDQGSSV